VLFPSSKEIAFPAKDVIDALKAINQPSEAIAKKFSKSIEIVLSDDEHRIVCLALRYLLQASDIQETLLGYQIESGKAASFKTWVAVAQLTELETPKAENTSPAA
jgi:hypothetical protein